MSLPYTPILTDVFGEPWQLNQPGCPVRVASLDLGMAPYKFDEAVGVNQQGVTVIARNDDPNAMPFKVYVDSNIGDLGPLRQWRRANGRGMIEGRASQLMKLTIAETGRYARIRLMEWKNQPNWVAVQACGRAPDEGVWRNDNSYWSAAEKHFSFTQAQLAAAKVFNDGDLSVWPRVKITGPVTNPAFGLADELITIPLTIPAGQVLTIQTDPDMWSIVDWAGNDRSWIGDRWHRKAEPTSATGITCRLTGAGMTSTTKLDVWLPQRYWGPL